MIDIKRTRYVVMDAENGNIFCGLARRFEFRSPENIKDIAIKTYLSEIKAKVSFEMSWQAYIYDSKIKSYRKWEWGKDYKIVKCVESLKEAE